MKTTVIKVDEKTFKVLQEMVNKKHEYHFRIRQNYEIEKERIKSYPILIP